MIVGPVVPVIPVVLGTVDGRDVRFWAGGAFPGGFSGGVMETKKRRVTHIYTPWFIISSKRPGNR